MDIFRDVDLARAGEPTGYLAAQESDMDSPYSLDMSNDLTRHFSSSRFVSPRDTWFDTTSAPPSTNFSELSTPNDHPFESPDVCFADNDSPLLGDLDDSFGLETMSMFPPLYPGKDRVEQPVIPSLNESYGIESSDTTVTRLQAPAMSRNGSSPGKAPTRSSQQGRPTGVTKSKRRAKGELPPVNVPDPTDPVQVKRARNTLAARKSRGRRADYTENLEDEKAQLQTEVESLRAELAQAYSIIDNHNLPR